MNKEKFDMYYNTLAAEVKAYNEQGRDITRYDLVRIIIGWDIMIDKDILSLIDRLYEEELIIE